MPEKLLRIEEAAELLGYAPFTIRRWLRDGKLRGVKTVDHARGRWRVPESAVEELAATFTPNRKAKPDTTTD
jgi:excisionase family DNA binding protein